MFTVPFVLGADLSAYRLRVRELEQSVFVPDPDPPPAPPGVMGTIGEVGRVVFSDIVPLQCSTATSPSQA